MLPLLDNDKYIFELFPIRESFKFNRQDYLYEKGLQRIHWIFVSLQTHYDLIYGKWPLKSVKSLIPKKSPTIFEKETFEIINPSYLGLEQFSLECRKTKTKVITLANHK